MNYKIAIIGLGYVGLPLASSFSKYFDVIGYDINNNRINELKNFNDTTNEVKKKFLKKIKFTNDVNELQDCNIFIITVPTPVTKNNKPDFSFLIEASKTVGSLIKKNSTIIYESTVYPGATEEICIPILEKKSNLKFNKEFYCGYSPERIDPGASQNKLENTVKIVSGSNRKAKNIVIKLYGKIIKAGLFVASNIKVAESAKIIENIQRDVNIALMNELSIFFDKSNIDTNEVIKAASTKWNFAKYRPGLVGGHCVSVDPYYFIHKAKKIKNNTKIISSARYLNEKMLNYHFEKIKKFIKKIKIKRPKVLYYGLTFKENCNDIRNSKYIELYKKLKKIYNIFPYDPIVNKKNIKLREKIDVINFNKNNYDILIVALNHKKFTKKDIIIIRNKYLKNKNNIFYLFDKF